MSRSVSFIDRSPLMSRGVASKIDDFGSISILKCVFPKVLQPMWKCIEDKNRKQEEKYEDEHGGKPMEEQFDEWRVRLRKNARSFSPLKINTQFGELHRRIGELCRNGGEYIKRD